MYATTDELRQRLGDMFAGLYQGLDGSPLEAEAESDLESASAEIDCLIGSRYTVPVTSGPAVPLLRSWCLTLAEEMAWMRSGKSDAPAGVTARATRVRDLLTRISTAALALPGTAEESAGMIITACDPPVFDRASMEGF